MNIELSEREAAWLEMLLTVHECEMSDTIIEKMSEWNLVAKETSESDLFKDAIPMSTVAESKFCGSTTGIPATGVGGIAPDVYTRNQNL